METSITYKRRKGRFPYNWFYRYSAKSSGALCWRMRRMIEIPLYERFLIRLNRFLAYKKSWTRSTFAAPTFALFVRDSINNQSYSRKEISIVCVFSVRGRCVSQQKNPMEIKCSYSAKSSWAFCAIAIKSAAWKPTLIQTFTTYKRRLQDIHNVQKTHL